MYTNLKAFLITTALFATSTFAELEDGMAPEAIAAVFKKYDVPEDEEPECQPSFVDGYLCPEDEEIPCSPIEEIEEYCKEILGRGIYNEMKNVPKNEGNNAIEGCIKYVGYHVVESNHLACCESEVCEEFLEKAFTNLENYYEDDDNVDDDDFEGEEF